MGQASLFVNDKDVFGPGLFTCNLGGEKALLVGQAQHTKAGGA